MRQEVGQLAHIYASHMLFCRTEHPSRRFRPANSSLLFKALFNGFPQSSGQDWSSFQAAHGLAHLPCAASPSRRALLSQIGAVGLWIPLPSEGVRHVTVQQSHKARLEIARQ